MSWGDVVVWIADREAREAAMREAAAVRATPTERMHEQARETAFTAALRAMDRDLAWAEHVAQAMAQLEPKEGTDG